MELGPYLQDYFEHKFDLLRQRGLLRRPLAHDPHDRLDLSVNDYLGFRFGSSERPSFQGSWGAMASPVLGGHHPSLKKIEAEFADFKQAATATFFDCGFLANLALIQTLKRCRPLFFLDQESHASWRMVEDLRRSRLGFYRHGDLDHLKNELQTHRQHPAKVIYTESTFSMTGTEVDPGPLLALAHDHDALLVVDEAHSVGLKGPEGAGMLLEHNDRLVSVCPLGKAFALQGAFIVGPAWVQQALYQYAKAYIYSTASSPILTGAVEQRLEEVRAADTQRSRLQSICDSLSHPTQKGPIRTIEFASLPQALEQQTVLRNKGLIGSLVRPPTVPKPILRFALHAALTDEDCALLRQTLGERI